MSIIKCKTPSTGYINNYTIPSLGTDWVTVAEAPEFSVPDARQTYTSRDSTDASRGIRPGEVFFLTPIFARNTSDNTVWVDCQLVLESGIAIRCPGRMSIPAGDTVLIPVQGRSLLKRTSNNQFGDRIQVKAEIASVLDIWATGEEKLSSEHTAG